MLLSYRDALNQAMREEMRRDCAIFLIGEEVGYYQGAFKVSKGFVEEVRASAGGRYADHGSRLHGPGHRRRHGGIAADRRTHDHELQHYRPRSDRQQRRQNQYMSGGQLSVPIVIRGPGSAAHQLGAQHSQSLEAWFCHVPGLKVVMPATPHDAKGLLKSAIRDKNPVIFIEAQLLYGTKGEVQEGEYTIPLGVADLKREGRDVTIVAYSKMLLLALEAAEQLRHEDIDVEVIDPRTLKPLDLPAIVNSVKKTGHLVIVEEGWRFCGLGAQIAESVYSAAFDYLDGPIVRVTGEDVPMPYSRPLEDAAIPNVSRVVAAVRSVCGVRD